MTVLTETQPTDATGASEAAVRENRELYAELEKSESKSMLKRFLTQEMFEELCTKKSTNGAILADVIRSGVKMPRSHIGVYASGGADSYVAFAPLFEKVIVEYHKQQEGFQHPAEDFKTPEDLPVVNEDLARKYVKSSRIRCARNFASLPMHGKLDEEGYKAVEAAALAGLEKLPAELQGKYTRVSDLSEEQLNEWVAAHLLFQQGDMYLGWAGANRHFPVGRGAYHSADKDFMVWLNEEDHLRIICLTQGHDIKATYRKWLQGLKCLESELQFAHHPRYGWLTFCPTNLGTSLRASVHVALPLQAANMEELEAFAAQFGIQVRGAGGEFTEAKGGVVDLSNKQRMGLTSFEAVQRMIVGMNAIMQREHELELKQ